VLSESESTVAPEVVFLMNLGHVSLWIFEVISSVEGSLLKLTLGPIFQEVAVSVSFFCCAQRRTRVGSRLVWLANFIVPVARFLSIKCPLCRCEVNQ
jgi:hypothetical protein